MRGGGSMIIAPRGKVIAEAEGADGLAIADVDPFGGREGVAAFNTQRDMRGRLFRERVPEAYAILTDPHPPALAKVPSNVTRDEAVRIFSTALLIGFSPASPLLRFAVETPMAIGTFEERTCSLRYCIDSLRHSLR